MTTPRTFSRIFMTSVVFFILPLTVSAQSAYLDKGVNGASFEARGMVNSNGFEGLGMTAGYSIAGIMDIGIDLGFRFYNDKGYDAVDTHVSFLYNVNVIRQSTTVPLSIQLTGSYGLIIVNSDYHFSRDEIKRGLVFTLGADVYRDFVLSPGFSFRIGVFGLYDSALYTIDYEEADPPAGYPNEKRVSNINFGGLAGLRFVTNKQSSIGITTKVRMNQDLQWQVVPALGVTLPSGDSHR